LKGHAGPVLGAAFSGDAKRVVTASEDGTARIWDTVSGRQTTLLKGHTDAVPTAAFSRNGRLLVTASFDNTARVWHTEQEITVYGGDIGARRGDGGVVRVAADGPTATIWDAESGKQIAVLKGHNGYVRAAAFSRDGKRVMTAAGDGTARIWDTGGG